jgi:uncharacterized protein (TIGR02246 family)
MAYRNPVEDELAIQDLGARYVDAVNRLDGQAWKATWAKDSTWLIMGQEIKGRENIFEFWTQTMTLFDFVIMSLNSGTVDINGDSASGRCYMTEYISMKGAGPMTTQGVYNDNFIKEDGEWLISSRGYHVLYQGPADLSGTYERYPAD